MTFQGRFLYTFRYYGVSLPTIRRTCCRGTLGLSQRVMADR